ncbi:hypothetical protein HII12_002023 [Brettanomyces bruxellensis]|uniref:Protein STU1 n=1 Tax=Dekkera bruxellensis TaxID=5007 RepID=A0A8H6BK30_DEKBR|nr:hypothetical protein HII12_002023 [Brettanomyces bruxellensis]
MSEEEPDYSSLPLEERLIHKVWKVRKEAYTELDEEFQNSASDTSDCFRLWIMNPSLICKAVSDINVVSQEAAIGALLSFLQYGGKRAAAKTYSLVIPSLCEKALSSSRAKTKAKTTEVLCMYVELGGSTATPVIELIIPSLKARSPRHVAAAVAALNDVYNAFGCTVCPPKLVMDQLPTLFKHADRNVRQEALKLSVTLRSYIGDAFETIIFPSLKPIQQKDLTKAFQKIQEFPARPTRLLKSEQERRDREAQSSTDGDVEMKDDAEGVSSGGNTGSTDSSELKPVDPYDLADPVDVLSQLPSDLALKVDVPKWKERVATLEDVKKTCDVMKVSHGDYSSLLRILSKSLGDANILVVTLAAETITELANGLRAQFASYVSVVIKPLLEATKEKKKSVADAVNGALESCFKYGSLEEISESCVQYMSHRIPQVRIAVSEYLALCLQNCNSAPSKKMCDTIFTTAIKHLDDPQVQVRTAMSKVIATMMKLFGERMSKPYVSKIAHRHMKKIEDIYSKIEVNAKVSSGETRSSSRVVANQARRTVSGSGYMPAGRKSSGMRSLSSNKSKSFEASRRFRSAIGSPHGSNRNSTIPSKREGSPLRMATSTNKMNLPFRSLRSGSGNVAGNRAGFPQSGLHNELRVEIGSTATKKELEELRKEKFQWQKERERLEGSLQQQISINEANMKKADSLTSIVEDYKTKFVTMNVALKSKDTRLRRLQSDLEVAKSRIAALERERRESDQEINGNAIGQGEINNEEAQVKKESDDLEQSPEEKELNTSFEKKAKQLNRRISRLSLRSEADVKKENVVDKSPNEKPSQTDGSKLASGLFELDSNDDSWKRAAEVTNQLKARIEQMKARTRSLSQM